MNMPRNLSILVAVFVSAAFAPLLCAADSAATAHANKGVKFAQEGAFDQAVLEFTEAIKLEPKDMRFYRDRGGVYLTTKRFQDAVNDFGKVIELAPKEYSGYSLREIGRAHV